MSEQAIPPREYWRVWSNHHKSFLVDYHRDCEHLAEWPERDKAQKEADRVNAIDRAERKKYGRHDLWPADYRPVLCRETVGPDIREALESAHAVMVTSSRDMARYSEDAWHYGIIVGWGDALPDVAAKHKWADADVERLRRMRATVEAMMAKDRSRDDG